MILPHGEKQLSFTKNQGKVLFLSEMEQLTRWALSCLRLNTGDTRYNAERVSYKRGCIDCVNFIVRACVNVPDVNLLKCALKTLSFTYIYFGETGFAVQTLERLRDVAMEDQDLGSVIFAYK